MPDPMKPQAAVRVWPAATVPFQPTSRAVTVEPLVGTRRRVLPCRTAADCVRSRRRRRRTAGRGHGVRARRDARALGAPRRHRTVLRGRLVAYRRHRHSRRRRLHIDRRPGQGLVRLGRRERVSRRGRTGAERTSRRRRLRGDRRARSDLGPGGQGHRRAGFRRAREGSRTAGLPARQARRPKGPEVPCVHRRTPPLAQRHDPQKNATWSWSTAPNRRAPPRPSTATTPDRSRSSPAAAGHAP